MGDPAITPQLQWPRFLSGESPQENLARMGDGDPLRLREGSSRRLREVWFLLDPDRVFHRAVAVCAKAAHQEDPPPDLTVWAQEKIDVAIEQLVQADREAERAHPEILSDEEMDFSLLTECLFMDPNLVRRSSSAFNALEPLPRRAFFELMIEGQDPDVCIENGPWDSDSLYDAIQVALATVNLDYRPDSAEERKKEAEES
jgi:hypothetical protein